MQETNEIIGGATKRCARSHQIRCEKELKEVRESIERNTGNN
jgi:hypothetical protein